MKKILTRLMLGFVCLFGIMAFLAGLLFLVAAGVGEFGRAIQAAALVIAAFVVAFLAGWQIEEDDQTK